jgi:hypothetical protein
MFSFATCLSLNTTVNSGVNNFLYTLLQHLSCTLSSVVQDVERNANLAHRIYISSLYNKSIMYCVLNGALEMTRLTRGKRTVKKCVTLLSRNCLYCAPDDSFKVVLFERLCAYVYYYYYYYYYYIIPFMQGIHTYIPETNHVSRVHGVAAIPRVLLMVHIALSSLLHSLVLLH